MIKGVKITQSWRPGSLKGRPGTRRVKVGEAVLRGYHNKPIPPGAIPLIKVEVKRKPGS